MCGRTSTSARCSLEPQALAHLVLIPNPPHHPRGDFGLEDGWLIASADRSASPTRASGCTARSSSRAARPGRFPLLPLLNRAIAARRLRGELSGGAVVRRGHRRSGWRAWTRACVGYNERPCRASRTSRSWPRPRRRVAARNTLLLKDLRPSATASRPRAARRARGPPLRKPPWLKARAPSGARLQQRARAGEGAPPRHRVRGGQVPEHR